MNTPTFESAIKQYLYFIEAYGKHKFIDPDNDNLIWTFENVECQTCFLDAKFIDSEAGDISEAVDLINNRRASRLRLITNVTKEIVDFEEKFLFEHSGSKSFLLCQNKSVKEQNFRNFSCEIIKDNGAFKRLIGSFSNWPPEIEKYESQLLFLLGEPFFTLKRYFLAGQSSIGMLVFEFATQDFKIIEYLNVDWDTTYCADLISKGLCEDHDSEKYPNTLFIVDQKYSKLIPQDCIIEKSEFLYYEKKDIQKRPFVFEPIQTNDTLKNSKVYLASTELLKALGVPKHKDLPKNWDSAAALSIIIRDKAIHLDSAILDAGGEYYSAIVHQLAAFGYENLFCMNKVFENSSRVGEVKYIPGDITETYFEENKFMAITCLSVIEHGVNIDKYLLEMSRILKPGGILFTSTDYWIEPVETFGKEAYGVPIKIFNKSDIQNIVDRAKNFGLELIDPISYDCEDRVVKWEGTEFTFIYFTFKKIRV
ncbi:methyltransferase domain-containing protein [Mucilaginibacter sp. OK098]|uniref:methyltransferase domain-containing protein n=1 Tax=Mucilaginibacter sp. OK098 TaxID=1855297 RepID=UPI0009204EA8|nr:methyltransferase domain-containing protein [Mucilaginibacter sp. OK098]SHN36119.1 Methyltransferase domain-containing protein [Mucilaginibacter sp. OK098]